MSENSFLRKALTETVLTRRSFLKWSAALGGTAALAGGLNYGFKAVEAVTASAAAEPKLGPGSLLAQLRRALRQLRAGPGWRRDPPKDRRHSP